MVRALTVPQPVSQPTALTAPQSSSVTAHQALSQESNQINVSGDTNPNEIGEGAAQQSSLPDFSALCPDRESLPLSLQSSENLPVFFEQSGDLQLLVDQLTRE